MRIGFTGSRQKPELHQQQKIISVLQSLTDVMTYAITGACLGVDTFIARWLAENTQVQQIVIFPAMRHLTDETLYDLPRAVFIDMPQDTKDNQCYKQRNKKIVELSDRVVAFAVPTSQGTIMTANLARAAGKFDDKDFHKL